jgi:predicted AAA+ superfamily ATPase
MRQQPGIIRDLRLDNFGPVEREITLNLATIWFVTHAGSQKLGKDTYPYLFLKASDPLREKFAFFANVLAVLHPYPSVDGRIIDTIEKILLAYPNRLDRLCVLLISNASSVDLEVGRLNGTSEARILVPFKYQELSGGVKGKEKTISDRLEQNLFTKDLFSISSALKTDRYFYGRKDDIRHLLGKYQTGENSAIFGLRRIGKTSVLWAVVRELKASNSPVAFVDCSDTKYHKARWNQTLQRVMESILDSNGMSGKGMPHSKYTESEASTSFAKDLQMLKHHFQKPTLIIFDEIESLSFDLASSNHWKSGPDFLNFWQTIRSIYQQSPNLFTFSICGVNPRVIETSMTPDGHDNPLYRYVESKYLGFFVFEEVKAMLEGIGGYMGITFDPEVVTYLTDDFGGHPFLIRQAASKMYSIFARSDIPRKIHISKHIYKEKRIEVSRSLHDYVSLILLILRERYADEYKLLQYLAAGQMDTFCSFASDDPTWIEHLIGYGLILAISGKYHFRINVVQAAVEVESKYLKSPDSVEERWELLSEARNAFESDLRNLVKSILKISLGANVGKSAIIQAMVKGQQQEKADALTYDQMYDAELYFSDLRRVVENNWNIFKNIFSDDQERFSTCMKNANLYRADAHAKSIERSEFELAMNAIGWLAKCLEENS